MVEFLDELQNPQALSARKRLLDELQAEWQELQQDGLHLFEAARLTRFLQGNNGSAEEAAAHFRRMLEWYRKADMNKKRLAVEGKAWNIDHVEGGRELFAMMCIDATRQMADGTMLWVQRDGLVQIEEIMAVSDEDLVHRMSLICELRETHLDRCSVESGRLVKFVQIRDLTGLNISAVVRNRAVMKRLADVFKIISTAYPETLSKMIIVNPPAGFNMLWMAVQPMLNQRIKQKFVFIPDGPFDFPKKLAETTGVSALQALADLGERDASEEWPPGRSSFQYRLLSPGCKAQWSFEVQPPGCYMQLQVIFFEEVEDGRPSPVTHEVFPMQAVTGAVSGHCGPLGVSGMLWFTWSNDSWTSTMKIMDLKITVDSSGEDELVRNPSSSSVLMQKRQRGFGGSGGSGAGGSFLSLSCCLPWFWEAVDGEGDEMDDGLGQSSQVLRHHRLRHHMDSPRVVREKPKVPLLVDEPQNDCGWEGGLGSPAFALLLLRLAVLVVIIATAQTCRKYVSLLQASL
eukprot:symbB.v1.2.021403.t2/scaffold1771.1/size122269/5